MNKEEFIKLYKSLNEKTINGLYEFSCLRKSGFKEDLAYKLVPLIDEIWRDDIACRCISLLSENLYEVYKNGDYSEDFLENTSKELLQFAEFEIDF